MSYDIAFILTSFDLPLNFDAILFLLINRLFVCCFSSSYSYEDVTITGERLQRRSQPMNSDGSLATFAVTLDLFDDPYHSKLFPHVCQWGC